MALVRFPGGNRGGQRHDPDSGESFPQWQVPLRNVSLDPSVSLVVLHCPGDAHGDELIPDRSTAVKGRVSARGATNPVRNRVGIGMCPGHSANLVRDYDRIVWMMQTIVQHHGIF